MKEGIKILVVEDEPGYLATAKEAVMDLKKEVNLNAEYINDFDVAITKISSENYDGVITDLFDENKKPKGLNVYIVCIENNIPVGILTDGDRHFSILGVLRDYLSSLFPWADDKDAEVKKNQAYQYFKSVSVDPERLKASLIKKKKENVTEKYCEIVNSVLKDPSIEDLSLNDKRFNYLYGLFYRSIIPKTSRLRKEEEALKKDGKNTMKKELFLEVAKEEYETYIKERLEDDVHDPVAFLEGFIIGRNGTNKYDKEKWKIAIQRVLKIGEIGKKEYFYWD